MNPTDQARKEARKRELKKNKKQRQMVRTAVLKGKNPRDIIFELEKVDDMEFNIVSPSPLNEKVLREKRRKLIETWNRVMRMYETDDNAQYLEFKKLWSNYLSRKNEVVQAFDAVKSAENVILDDIPLPMPGEGEDSEGETEGGGGSGIPLPPTHNLQPKSSILKKPPSVLDSLKPKTCPGVPAGPPPLLSDYVNDNDGSDGEGGNEGGERDKTRRTRKIRFEGGNNESDSDDERPPGTEDRNTGKSSESGEGGKDREDGKSADKDVDAYMKELEEVHLRQQAADRMRAQLGEQPPPPGLGPPGAVRPPGLMYRPAPPPLRPGIAPPGVRLPPGPPPGRPPAPGATGVRLPPGPPPGVPRRGLPPAVRPQSVVSAGPQLFSSKPAEKQATVIQAKPQMRNLMSDVTRFVPTHVKARVDKGGGVGGGRKPEPTFASSNAAGHNKSAEQRSAAAAEASSQQGQRQGAGKDDAYAQFMKEMEQIMK